VNNVQGAHRPQTSPLTSGEQFAHEEGVALQSEIQAKLVIQRGGKVGKEFFLSNPESLIGRWDADGGIFPEVDLDQDDPEAKISRRHARIQFLNNQFLIEDLGSTNGTFINRGPRLLPGNKQPLKHGDEIIVGKTFLKFVLN
jgi:pSer/pThr/pTyr-binding forkhead associated (FHA) protein